MHINGKRIKEQKVEFGDRVRFGANEIEIIEYKTLLSFSHLEKLYGINKDPDWENICS